MLIKKRLVYLNNCAFYNDRKINPFLEIELPYLAEHFDEVIVVNNQSAKNYIPEYSNVKVINKTKIDVIRTVFCFFGMLLDSHIIKQLWEMLLVRGIKILDILKFILFVNRGKLIAARISKFCTPQKGLNILIYSFWMDYEAYAAALIKEKYKNIKAVTRAHSYEIYQNRNPLNPFLMRKYIHDKLDSICFISEKGLNTYVCDIYNEPNDVKLHIIHMGVISLFGKVEMYAEKDKYNYFFIVSCARLVSIKRIELIIKSIYIWKGKRIKWVHLGGGPEMENLISLGHQLLDTKENVQWSITGNISNQEIHNFYSTNKVDLFISVSENEGIPVSFMEAMSYSIPVLSTNVGAINEIVNNKNGIIISANPLPQEICGQLHKFLKLTPNEKIEMRKRAYQCWNDKFNLAKNIKEMLWVSEN